VIAEGVERGWRQGIHCVGTNEFLDIEYIGISWILSPRAGPEGALDTGATSSERSKWLTIEYLTKAPVYHLRIGDGDTPPQS
jgi:hypothetical protein